MKKGSIILTKDEKKYLDTLSPEDKELYGHDAFMKRVRLMSELTVLITRMLEVFDELEVLGMIRSKIKIASRPFLIQVNSYIDNLFKMGDDPVYGNNWIVKKTKEIQSVFGYNELKQTKESKIKFKS